jgi:hypothetical protein
MGLALEIEHQQGNPVVLVFFLLTINFFSAQFAESSNKNI